MTDERDEIPQPGDAPADWRSYAWYPVLGGVAAIALAALIGLADTSHAGAGHAGRIVLSMAGMFALGVGVWLRPANVGGLVLTALAALAARHSFPDDWDSGRLLACAGAIAAAIAALLVALPQVYRRAGVIVLVLLHFACILSSVTGPPTGDKPPPWWTQVSYTYLFRPYAEFVYLKNAYHFYSPEPGPASLVWFCIYYENGDTRWLKVPRRPEDVTDPLGLEYYRRLSLTMQLENYAPVYQIPPDAFRRRDAVSYGPKGIPWRPDMPREQQWQPPSDPIRRFLLPSYVRHVASLPANQHDDGHTPIKSVKVYRVTHMIIQPVGMPASKPYDRDTYLPYFQGEYAADGTPINLNDPMLFWVVPIIYVPKNPPAAPGHTHNSHPQEFELRDGLLIHSGSDPEAK